MNRCIQGFLAAATSIRSAVAMFAQEVASRLRLRGPRWIWATTAVGALALGIGWGWSRPSTAIASGSGQGKYLVVCTACEARSTSDVPPLTQFEERDGSLNCPRCQRFSAAWYRRGSLDQPPGGW